MVCYHFFNFIDYQVLHLNVIVSEFIVYKKLKIIYLRTREPKNMKSKRLIKCIYYILYMGPDHPFFRVF